MLRRTMSLIAVAAFAAALATAPMAASPAFAKSHSPLKAGECSAVLKEETQSSKLGSSFASAMASGNFAKIKAALLAEFGQLGSAVNKVNGFLSGAPGNVKAAFNTILNQFNSLKSKIQATTNLQQLGQAFTSFGTNAKLVAASKTLSSYFGTRCT